MPKRKVWSEEEDKILKFLREERGQRKWETIARIMQFQFGIVGRSGKQCRQRYHNHLDASIVTSEWRPEQEQILLNQHEQIGNKWSAISQKLPGRSDNCVKNHFYSKLRKSIRKLNKIIDEQFQQAHEHIKLRTLYKIIEVQESKFKINTKVDEDLADFCKNIKNRLFTFEGMEGQNEEIVLEEARKLIADVNWFQENHKKGYRAIKRDEYEPGGKHYLKPPSSSIKRSDSISSNKSDDSSFLSSSSYVSSLSDLSECEDNKKSKTTRSRRGSSGVNSDIIKEEIADQHYSGEQSEVRYSKPQEQLIGMRPQEFMREHEHLIIQDEDIKHQEEFQQELFNGMMYQDTPVMARILAPSMHFDDVDFQFFPKGIENEDDAINFKDEAHEEYH